MLTHRVLAQASFAYLDRSGRDRAGRLDPACGADEPWLGPLHDGACGAARDQRGAGVRQLRAGRDLPPVRGLERHVDVRRAHDGEAPGRLWRRREPGQPAHHRVGRRADVCRGRSQGARPLRAAPRADLRPGRKPDDDHDAVAAGDRRSRSSALARAPRLGRPAVRLPRRDGGGCGRSCAPRRRDRRDPLPRRCRHAGLLAQSGGDRRDHARRLAAHRRRRRVRPRGVPDPEGSLQGRDHLGRLEHLSARSGGGAAQARAACARPR